jgi:hypothetical protein
MHTKKTLLVAALLISVLCHMSPMCHMCLAGAGLVYTGGLDGRFKAWDPRAGGAGAGINAVLNVDCQGRGDAVYSFPSLWAQKNENEIDTGKSSPV